MQPHDLHARLTVANPKTNTLYLFIFESPIAGWMKAWKIGKQILDTLPSATKCNFTEADAA